MIRVTIAGRVGRSELKDINGTQLLSFSVAADVRSGREKETVWASCSLWGKRADALAQYVTKGSQVTVTGAGRIGLDLVETKGQTVLYAAIDNYFRRPKEAPEEDELTKDQLREMTKANW